jgi:prepilin peptidase CpaA
VLGLAYHTFSPQGWGAGLALAGFAIGFVLLLLPWLLGGGGMGDVKMLAALGAWLGPVLILITFGLGTVLGMIMAIGVMFSSVATVGVSTTQRRFITSHTPASEARRARRVVPFAVPVAVGTVLVLLFLVLRTHA